MRRRTLLAKKGGGGETVDPSNSAYCDICLYDGDEEKLVIVPHDDWSERLYPASRYTPVGIVVIPGTHDVWGTGQCGVMSIVPMSYSTPDTGATSETTMCWGEYNTDTSLTNYNAVVNIGTASSQTNTANGTSTNDYLPSDAFSSVQCKTDPVAYYYSSSYSAAPSPYLEDGSRNSVYYQTESPSSTSNAFSDFDGVGNTQVLCKLATGQSDWKTADTITNNSGAGYTPAACCCWRYHTNGTSQGDWYLPACGEIGYMIVRRKTINETISSLNAAYGVGVQLDTSNYYWSSTEYSSNSARNVSTNSGYTNYSTKGNSYHVRAFLRVPLSAS